MSTVGDEMFTPMTFDAAKREDETGRHCANCKIFGFVDRPMILTSTQR